MLEASPNPLLQLSAVRKAFGGLTAVSDVTLPFDSGEIIGVIGPNGAGKTTHFNLIAGKDRPTSGKIHFDGRDITSFKPDRRCRLGIGRTFQVPKPFMQMTVFENIKVAMMFGSSTRPADLILEVEGLVQELGLERWIHEDVSSLPLGARKKLEVARALATRQKILLLDEVMGGLRSGEIDNMIEVIRNARSSGITIVLIEHVMRAVMALSDRIVVLHHGSLIADGTPQEVTSDRAVIEAYLGGSHDRPQA